MHSFSSPYWGSTPRLPFRNSLPLLAFLFVGALAPATGSAQTITRLKAGKEVTAARSDGSLYGTVDSKGDAWEYDAAGGVFASYAGMTVMGYGPPSNAAKLLRDADYKLYYDSLDGTVPVVDANGDVVYESMFAGSSGTSVSRGVDAAFSGTDSLGNVYAMGAPSVNTIFYAALDGGKVLAGGGDRTLRYYNGSAWSQLAAPYWFTFRAASANGRYVLGQTSTDFQFGTWNDATGAFDFASLGPLFSNAYFPSATVRDNGSFALGTLDRFVSFGPGGVLDSMMFLDPGVHLTAGGGIFDFGKGSWLFGAGDSFGRSTYLYAPQAVPEPASAAALGLGTFLAASRRSRKRNP